MDEQGNDISSSQKGVSNSTIAVLIILALVMTIIGTLAVINSSASNPGPTMSAGNNIGKVSLQVLPSEPVSTGATETSTEPGN